MFRYQAKQLRPGREILRATASKIFLTIKSFGNLQNISENNNLSNLYFSSKTANLVLGAV